HGGTPVLAPQRRAATTLNGFVKNNILNNRTYTCGQAQQTRSNKHLPEYESATVFFPAFVF
ncbi:hypothetical protein ACVGXP_03550, partial [Enterobacter hormaechei]